MVDLTHTHTHILSLSLSLSLSLVAYTGESECRAQGTCSLCAALDLWPEGSAARGSCREGEGREGERRGEMGEMGESAGEREREERLCGVCVFVFVNVRERKQRGVRGERKNMKI